MQPSHSALSERAKFSTVAAISATTKPTWWKLSGKSIPAVGVPCRLSFGCQVLVNPLEGIELSQAVEIHLDAEFVFDHVDQHNGGRGIPGGHRLLGGGRNLRGRQVRENGLKTIRQAGCDCVHGCVLVCDSSSL